MKKTIYSFLGLPGSGKGTQAEIFKKEVGAEGFISVGTLIRDFIAKGEDTEYSRQVKARYDEGTPQPDEVAIRLLSDYLKNAKSNIILDNFPFGAGQAEFLLEFIKENPEWGGPIVIHIKIMPETAVARISSRLFCPECGATFDSTAGKVCLKCGTDLQTRKDDSPEIVRKRLSFYIPKIDEVIAYLEKQSVTIHEVDGERTVAEIVSDLKELTHE